MINADFCLILFLPWGRNRAFRSGPGLCHQNENLMVPPQVR